MNITIRTLAGATLATLLASTAWAQDHTFKFQSSDPAGNPNFGLQKTGPRMWPSAPMAQCRSSFCRSS